MLARYLTPEIGDSLAACGVALALERTVYDPTDPVGKLFFNLVATFAEFEVDLLRMRTREGMAIARQRGKLKGTPPKLKPRRQEHLIELHGPGKDSIADLATLFSISRATVYRTLERSVHGPRTVPPPGFDCPGPRRLPEGARRSQGAGADGAPRCGAHR